MLSRCRFILLPEETYIYNITRIVEERKEAEESHTDISNILVAIVEIIFNRCSRRSPPRGRKRKELAL